MSQLVHAFRGDMSSWSGDGPAITVPPRSLSARTVAAAHAALAGRSHGRRRYLAFAGPAIVASIAYMDPSNFATNIEAGGRYGYGLLWMVLLANLVAMLFQALSAKLGIVTGRNLAELSREWFPPPLVWTMWAVSEVAAMATDLAEFLGGAIGLSLLLIGAFGSLREGFGLCVSLRKESSRKADSPPERARFEPSVPGSRLQEL